MILSNVHNFFIAFLSILLWELILNYLCDSDDMLCFIFLQSVFISRVAETGPAHQCGVKVGDRLISVSIISLIFVKYIFSNA